MDKFLLQRLLKVQADLLEGRLDLDYLGICAKFEDHFEPYEPSAVLGRLHDLMCQWPEFSGDRQFPVPDNACEFGGNPVDAFYGCAREWSNDHEYGRARRRLLAWLIETLRAETGEQ